MAFLRRTPKLSKQEALAARPVRMVEGEMKPGEGNSVGKLTVKVRQAAWAAWLFRTQQGTTKTFEFDPMGMLVWDLCDGKTSVQQIIRKLAKRYKLSLREAEVSTRQFLRTLGRKGLIGFAVPGKQGAEKNVQAKDV